ncbi:MAG: hypothetical protein Q9170_001966 [Blastenia crenularia]
MAIVHHIVSFTAFITFATSLALLPPPSQDSSLYQAPSALPGPFRISAPGSSTTNPILQAALNSSDPLTLLRNASQGPLGRPVMLCNGDEYGYNLPLQSCMGALIMIPDITLKLSFGPRTQGRFNFETPYRLLSGDGLCAVDFERNSNALTDVARGSDLVKASQYLLAECYSENRQGGIVRNLGDHEHINMIIRTYTPNVQCSTSEATAPKYPDCLTILAQQMSVDKTTKVFGKAGAPLVREVLPKTIVDSSTLIPFHLAIY